MGDPVRLGFYQRLAVTHEDECQCDECRKARIPETCIICKKQVGENNPWTICFDPAAAVNVWGGDSHEVKAQLCEQCAEELLEMLKK